MYLSFINILNDSKKLSDFCQKMNFKAIYIKFIGYFL